MSMSLYECKIAVSSLTGDNRQDDVFVFHVCTTNKYGFGESLKSYSPFWPMDPTEKVSVSIEIGDPLFRYIFIDLKTEFMKRITDSTKDKAAKTALYEFFGTIIHIGNEQSYVIPQNDIGMWTFIKFFNRHDIREYIRILMRNRSMTEFTRKYVI